MQDDVAELLRSATRDYANTKVCVLVCAMICRVFIFTDEWIRISGSVMKAAATAVRVHTCLPGVCVCVCVEAHECCFLYLSTHV